MTPRVTITRNRQGRVRIGFSSEDFARVSGRLATLAADEAQCQRAIEHIADAESLERLANALNQFEADEDAVLDRACAALRRSTEGTTP